MTATSDIIQFGDHLYLIALPVPIAGFDGFVGAWVHAADPVVIVDVGPASTSGDLIAALSRLGVERPDLILLTHIHIDHAGAIGALAEHYDGAPVVCHPKACTHVAEPERLWQGSLKTLGRIAEAYGPIAPVEAKRLIGSDQLTERGIVAIETPGHAAHHVSYLIGDLLFAGEACGVNLPIEGGIYLRPATPPRFFLETSVRSLDALIDLNPGRICYGHVGLRNDAMALMTAHRDQLLRWKDMISPCFVQAGEDRGAAVEACIDGLLESDPLLGGFPELAQDVQIRERGFLSNSVLGYWGYLESLQ